MADNGGGSEKWDKMKKRGIVGIITTLVIGAIAIVLRFVGLGVSFSKIIAVVNTWKVVGGIVICILIVCLTYAFVEYIRQKYKTKRAQDEIQRYKDIIEDLKDNIRELEKTKEKNDKEYNKLFEEKVVLEKTVEYMEKELEYLEDVISKGGQRYTERRGFIRRSGM